MPRYESVGDTTRAWRRLRAFLEADESVSSAALIEAACDALETSTVDGATCVPIIAALREAVGPYVTPALLAWICGSDYF